MISFLDENSVGDGNFPARSQKNHRWKCHDSQPPELDKKEENELAGQAEIGSRLLDSETCHTYRWSRSKKGIDEGDLSWTCAEGEKKSKSPNQDGNQEADGQDLSRLK